MKIILTNHIEIEAPFDELQQIYKQLTFYNPKYAEAQKHGRSVRFIDKQIHLAKVCNDSLIAPIGALNYLLQTFNPKVSDQRHTEDVNIPFLGELRAYQETFINQAINAKGGQCIAATGSGKTVSGIAMASRLQQRTLILVKSKDLAKQWQGEIKKLTGLDAGLIGGGKNSECEQFTIGLTQTLCKRDLSDLDYGLVIADEVHNIAARQAFTVINGVNARYKYGLSATPQRRDNLEFMIDAAMGGVCSEIHQDQLDGKVLPVRIRAVEQPFYGHVESWTEFLNVLVDDEVRNLMIVDVALKASKTMGTIILCSQVRHCELLASMCRDAGTNALTLHGQLPTKERAERMAAAPQAQLIIGTLSLLSEGIDLPHLTALIFAAPVSAQIDKDNPSATRLIQSIGRCRRPYPGKQHAYVLDIIDQCGFGVSAWNKRRHIYQLQGFEVVR